MTMTTTQKTTEGQRITVVGRDGSRTANVGGKMSFPIWTGKVYEARRRKRDGVLTWQLVESVGGTVSGHAPSDRFRDSIRAIASNYSDRHITHGQVCE